MLIDRTDTQRSALLGFFSLWRSLKVSVATAVLIFSTFSKVFSIFVSWLLRTFVRECRCLLSLAGGHCALAAVLMTEKIRSERIKGIWRIRSLTGLRKMSGRGLAALPKLLFLAQDLQLPRQQGYFTSNARCLQNWPLMSELLELNFNQWF